MLNEKDKKDLKEQQEENKFAEENNITIINEYLSYNIVEPDLFLYITLFLSTYFFYLKVIDNFIALWRVTFYPIYFYVIFHFLKALILILKSDIVGSEDSLDDNKTSSGIKISNLISIAVISNFYKLILYALATIMVFNLHQFLDNRNDENLHIALYVLMVILFWSTLYFIFRQLRIFKFKPLKSKNSNTGFFNNIFVFSSTLLTPALTYFSNMMIICSGGACSQIYVSTITSLLGAFGITFSQITKFMFPITCVLLGISVFSLYIKRRKWKHKPFLLGVVSAIIIIIGNYFDKGYLHYLIYPGNIMMIAAAIWNAKRNKFYGLPC